MQDFKPRRSVLSSIIAISSKVRISVRKKFSRERTKCRVSIRIDVDIDLIRDVLAFWASGHGCVLREGSLWYWNSEGFQDCLLKKQPEIALYVWYIAPTFKCYIIGLSRDLPIVISREREIRLERIMDWTWRLANNPLINQIKDFVFCICARKFYMC